jgi:hypothetical protein
MNSSEEINWQGNQDKWLAYFDILGFSALLEEQGLIGALSVYEMCVDEVQSHSKRYPKLSFAYFSDTFLIYGPDDSQSSMAAVEQSARWFFNILLLKRVPFRGALACGEFLAEPAQNLFIGKALVEASRLGEKYNWIGYVLTPSAVSRLEALKLPAPERLNYREWAVPFKVKGRDQQETEKRYAYLIGASSPVNGKNQYIQVLNEMANGIKSPGVTLKYHNTIEFLEKCGLLSAIPNSMERELMWGNDPGSKT